MNKNFSVLLAVYFKDDPALLNTALNSIVCNTIQPESLVVVADGELTPDLLRVIELYKDQVNLTLVQLPKNVGLAHALNAGLAQIHTKYTVRADADDFNHSTRFETLIDKLEEGYELVGSAIDEFDKMGNFVATRSCPVTENEIRFFARRRNPFNHMSVGFLTSSVVEVGGYPSIHLKEDYALWANLLAKGCRVCNLSAVLVNVTAGTEMFRRRGGFRYAMAEVELQRHLVSCGLKSHLCAFFDGLSRAMIFLAPNAVREFIYLKFLRVQREKS